MKRFLIVLLSVVFLFGSLAMIGCNEQKNDQKLKFYVPDGAPALAVAKYINDGQTFGIDRGIDYTVVSSDDIGAIMMKGEGDFIVMPINAASKLYKANKNDPYVMTAVVTHGNLYIMSSDGSSSLDQLKGKVVGVIGQGLVPDLTLRSVLSDSGLLSDVVVGDTASVGKITLKYFAGKTAAQDMIALLKQGKLNVGLLPEPAATNLTKKASEKTWTRIDLQKCYDSTEESYPQACLMVKKSVYNKYKNKIEAMAQTFDDNVVWIKQNTAKAVDAVNSNLKEGLTPSLVSASITAEVVENCKIYYQTGQSAKLAVEKYINKIIAINAQSANAVKDDFFCIDDKTKKG